LGQRVRHKITGTIWKVIEEREVWVEAPDPAPDGTQLVPAIHLRYWRFRPDLALGKGKTLFYAYTLEDRSFAENWEILEE